MKPYTNDINALKLLCCYNEVIIYNELDLYEVCVIESLIYCFPKDLPSNGCFSYANKRYGKILLPTYLTIGNSNVNFIC